MSNVLNSSGALQLGGTTAGQSIEWALGESGTAALTMNDANARQLAGVPSGAYWMTAFYGQSLTVTLSYTFTTNTPNASLVLSSLSGYLAGRSNITVTVNPGVYLYSVSAGVSGLTLTGATTGDNVSLVVNGYIMGLGGTGGSSNGAAWIAPTAGGTALTLGYNITLSGTGYIAGGGGGGGGNIGYANYYGGGGGGAGGGLGGSIYANSGMCCNVCTSFGYSGGAAGGVGQSGSSGSGNSQFGGGGGGGRILPGTGGVTTTNGAGQGGGAGGSGAGINTLGYGGSGGSGANAGNPPTNGLSVPGGGGGWGAAGGGSGHNGGGISQAGAAGGKAINLNGYTKTAGGSTPTIYGAVA